MGAIMKKGCLITGEIQKLASNCSELSSGATVILCRREKDGYCKGDC
jgi:hypothetical protein